MNSSYADKTFVILGTSHYGEPEKFGLTRKPYLTPWGPIETDVSAVDRLAAAAPAAVEMEDYCHASEHSIEFQCIFLAHALGTTDFNIIPILCGPPADGLFTGRRPEANDGVRSFFDALGEAAEERRRVGGDPQVDGCHRDPLAEGPEVLEEPLRVGGVVVICPSKVDDLLPPSRNDSECNKYGHDESRRHQSHNSRSRNQRRHPQQG